MADQLEHRMLEAFKVVLWQGHHPCAISVFQHGFHLQQRWQC